MTVMKGEAAGGFGAVREAFEHVLSRYDQAGASLCIYKDGHPVVDLWGGVNPLTGKEHDADTVTVIFSATKAATAICAHMLVQRGLLDVDAPVARYWPEFAQNGKEKLLVRWLLSHQSGLSAIASEAGLAVRDYPDWDRVISALARQRPWWEPGTAFFYHSLTFGFLVGEVVRRVSGKSPGRFFADEIAGPLDLNFWIGMPEAKDRTYAPGILPATVSNAYWAGVPENYPAEALRKPTGSPAEALRALGFDPTARASQVGLARAQLLMPEDGNRGSEFFNSRAFRAAEIPASNGTTNGRGLARMYAALIGEVDGIRLLDPDTLERACRCQNDHLSEPPGDVSANRGVPPRLGLGFQLPTVVNAMLGDGSFGHSGAGGRLGFAHPERGIAFGYVSTQLWPEHASTDPRWTLLIDALKRCL